MPFEYAAPDRSVLTSLARQVEVRKRIFADLVDGMAKLASDGGYRLPMPALVGRGRE